MEFILDTPLLPPLPYQEIESDSDSCASVTKSDSDSDENESSDDDEPNHLSRRPRTNANLNQAWQLIFNKNISESEATTTTVRATNTNSRRSRTNHQTILGPANTSNEPWGDEVQDLQMGNIRIWSQNVNGISTSDNFADFVDVCDELKTNSASIICLQETNIDWLQYRPRARCEQILRDTFGKVRLITSTSSVKSPSFYKPGGTCMAIVGDWTGRIMESGADDLGRWTWARISGINGHTILIVNVYNVCKNNIEKAGPTTAFAQQWKILRLSGQTMPNPRKQLVKDLCKQMDEWRDRKCSFFITGDINEVLGRDPYGFAEITAKFNLTEINGHLHSEPPPATYARGSDKIDISACSETLLPWISKTGYTRFNEFVISDHRANVIDLVIKGALGNAPSIIVKPNTRNVGSKSTRIPECLEKAYVHCIKTGVFTKITEFQDHIATKDDIFLQKNANKIDHQLTKSLLAGDNKLKRQPKPPWSQKLKIASKTVRYWKTNSSAITLKMNMDKELHALGTIIWPGTFPHICHRMKEVNEYLTKAQKRLREIRNDAARHRREFLEEIREAAIWRENGTRVQAIKKIEQSEASKRVFQRLKRVLADSQTDPIMKVDIPTGNFTESIRPDGTTSKNQIFTRVSDRDKLEDSIIERNVRHFSQSYTDGTPFAVHPLDKVGTSATGFKTHSTPDGDPVIFPTNSFVETRAIHEILQEELKGAKIQCTITLEDLVDCIAHWRESTSTSPSGLHLGIWKALVTAYKNKNDEFSDAKNEGEISTQKKATLILEAYVTLLNSAIEKGFYLDRWLKIVNVMIYKKPGSIDIESLRVIHLFEADFNLVIGLIFGRRTIYQAIDNGWIPDSQVARPYSECTDGLLSKVLHMEIAHTTKTSLGGTDFDAASCFDRIRMNYALSIYRQHGVSESACKMWEQTLHNVIHHVKTGYGISEKFYKYTKDSPIDGAGQGSKGAMAAWTFSSVPMILAMDKLANGATFTDPYETIEYKGHGSMFVDDESAFANKFKDWLLTAPTYSEVGNLIRSDGQIWERLLWTTGGLLRLSKCFYYIISWKWNSEGVASLRTKEEMGDNVALTSGTNHDPVQITHSDCRTANRSLGALIAADRKFSAERQRLQTIDDKFSTKIVSNSMTAWEAWTAYFTIYLPRIRYTLAITHFTRKELEKIQKGAVRAVLSKIGFNRSTARAVVFAPPWFGGLGMRQLYVEQGVAQLETFIRHIRSETRLGDLIRIALGWLQVQAGISEAIFADTSRKLPYLTPGWLVSIREFLSTCNGSMQILHADTSLPKNLREFDFVLMDVVNSNWTKKSELLAFNRCRLYLKVNTLAEISTADGKSIDKQAWVGTRPAHTTHLWPLQEKPGPKSWQTWRRLLARKFMNMVGRKKVTAKTKDLRLRRKLGLWRPGSEECQQNFHQFYDPQTRALYCRSTSPTLYHRFDRCLTQRLKKKEPHLAFRRTHHYSTLFSLPPNATPCSSFHKAHKTTKQYYGVFTPIPRQMQAPPPAPTPTTWAEYVSTLPHWEFELVASFSPLPSQNTLQECLQKGIRLIFASDGGAIPKYGAFGCVIATDTEILWEGGNQCAGNDPRSFRAEGYGMLANALFIQHFIYFHQIIPAKIFRRPSKAKANNKFVCDNDPLILRVTKGLSLRVKIPRRTLYSEADIELGIIHAIKSFPFSTSLEWVEGHQREKYPDRELSREAILNDRADEIATIVMTRVTQHLPQVPFIPASQLLLTINNVSVTHHIPTNIRLACAKAAHRTYLCKHLSWPIETYESIDWEAHQASLSPIRQGKKNFLIKWNHKLLGVGRRIMRYNSFHPYQCPSCTECPIEDDPHILQCKARRPALIHRLTPVWDFLQSYHTESDLYALLMHGLLAPTYQSFTVEAPPYPNDIGNQHRALYDDQSRIGWSQLFHGRFSQQWAIAYDAHISTLQVDRRIYTGQIWVRKIITLIWEALHLTWKDRNADLHRHKAPAPLRPKRIQLLAEIQALYDEQPYMLSCDRSIFDIPMSTRKHHSTNGLKHFLALAKPIVTLSKADATEVFLSGQTKIRSFLHAPPIPPHLIDILADLPSRFLPNRPHTSRHTDLPADDDPELPEDDGPPDPDSTPLG